MKNFDFKKTIPPVRHFLVDFCEGLEMSPLEIVERIVVDWMARDIAEYETWGKHRFPYLEFTVFEDDESLKQLFKMLIEKYREGHEERKLALFEQELKTYKDHGMNIKELYAKFGYNYDKKDK